MAHQAAKLISKLFKLESGGLLDVSAGKTILRVQTKTASYSVLETDTGSIFVTVGDTDAIVYTLPTVPKSGTFYVFFQSVDQNMTVNAGSANTMRTYNDLDADGVVFSTTSQKIGACILVFGDGTYWNVAQLCTNTMTVTT